MALGRRTLLTGGAFVAAAGALFGQIAVMSDNDLVKRRLRQKLPDLDMAEAELTRFATEFLHYYRSPSARRRGMILFTARAVESISPTLREQILPSAIATPFQRFERELFRAFFLGTDYIDMRQVPGATVNFYQIPDPYRVGCANTLARFD